MKIGARNRLKGIATQVTKAADELKLAKGQTAHAVIEASDVMVAVDRRPLRHAS